MTETQRQYEKLCGEYDALLSRHYALLKAGVAAREILDNQWQAAINESPLPRMELMPPALQLLNAAIAQAKETTHD